MSATIGIEGAFFANYVGPITVGGASGSAVGLMLVNLAGLSALDPAVFAWTMVWVQEGSDPAYIAYSNGTDWIALSAGGAGSWTVVPVTSDYTASYGQFVICQPALGPALTVTLPAASAGVGKQVAVKNDASNGFVGKFFTVLPGVGSTIDGASSFVVDNGNTAVIFVSDGTNWYTAKNFEPLDLVKDLNWSSFVAGNVTIKINDAPGFSSDPGKNLTIQAQNGAAGGGGTLKLQATSGGDGNVGLIVATTAISSDTLPLIASASTITLTKAFAQVSGTATISTINPPNPNFIGRVTLYPTGAWKIDASGNVMVPSTYTASFGVPVDLVYDSTFAVWYLARGAVFPSYSIVTPTGANAVNPGDSGGSGTNYSITTGDGGAGDGFSTRGGTGGTYSVSLGASRDGQPGIDNVWRASKGGDQVPGGAFDAADGGGWNFFGGAGGTAAQSGPDAGIGGAGGNGGWLGGSGGIGRTGGKGGLTFMVGGDGGFGSNTGGAGGDSGLTGGTGGLSGSSGARSNGGKVFLRGGRSGGPGSGSSGGQAGDVAMWAGAGRNNLFNSRILVGYANDANVRGNVHLADVTTVARLYGFLSGAATSVASASTISPTSSAFDLSGTATISTITPNFNVSSPYYVLASDDAVVLFIRATGAWSTTTGGNVANAVTAADGDCFFAMRNASGNWVLQKLGTSGGGGGPAPNEKVSLSFSRALANGVLTASTAGGNYSTGSRFRVTRSGTKATGGQFYTARTTAFTATVTLWDESLTALAVQTVNCTGAGLYSVTFPTAVTFSDSDLYKLFYVSMREGDGAGYTYVTAGNVSAARMNIIYPVSGLTDIVQDFLWAPSLYYCFGGFQVGDAAPNSGDTASVYPVEPILEAV